MKLILIIGGTSGIGLHTAKHLVNKNYKVIICGRRYSNHDNIIFHKVDVTKNESILKLHSEILDQHGDIDGLIYSTGITAKKKKIESFDEEIWNKIISTNVTGLLITFKYFFSSLKKTKGKVVVINSVASKLYSEFSGVEYTASKAALSGIVKQTAIEWSKYNILVNSIIPSMTLTPMLQENYNDYEIDLISDKLPLKKLAGLDDVSRSIEFLISEDNTYITGSGLNVTGGIYLNA